MGVKIKKIIFIITLFIFSLLAILSIAIADPPNIEWEKNLGDYHDEQAYDVQQTSDGGYILVGETYSGSPFESFNFYLVKTDSNGNKIWEKFFGSTDEEIAHSVQQTSDGGYIIAGETYSSDLDLGKAYVIKTNSLGNKVWEKTFGMGEWSGADSVQQTSDGGYIVAGDTNYPDNWNVYLLKIDSNGNKIWEKAIGGSDIEGASDVQQTSDGGYIISGERGFIDESSDVYLVKTDSSGNKQWEKTFNKNKNDYADSVQQTSDGGYILAGETGIFYDVPESTDIYLIKTSSNGNMVWEKIFGGNDAEWAGENSVQQTTDGGYIVTGFTASFGRNGEAYLIKTDSNGNKVWEKVFGGVYADAAQAVQQTSDDGYIVAGLTTAISTAQDMYLVKLSFGPASSCTDGIKNSDETDIDCGGSCLACENGKNCKINSDCQSNYCNPYKICEANCNNGIKDGDETDVDCGGSCPKCQNGKSCLSNFDCLSKFCSTNNICFNPNCANKIQDGDEQGVDCGGSCPVVCGNYCKPFIVNGNSDDKIDIIFVPDITYKDNLNLFRQHIGQIINNSYMNSTPIRNNINKFNFYYIENFSRTNWTACNESRFNCEHKLPKNFKKECKFREAVAIIHTDKQRDFTSGVIFSSTYYMNGTFVHETGHAIFGLADEYCCDSYYFEPEPFPNIWSSNRSCRDYATNNGWTPNDCNLFCDPNMTIPGRENHCGDGWWRSDPNPDIMRSGGYRVSPFQRADLKNVYWTFDQYPGTTIKINSIFTSETEEPRDIKAIILDLNFKDTKVNLTDIAIAYNNSPDYVTQSGNINIKLLKNNVTIKDMKIWDPRIIRTEERAFYLRESKVSVTVQVNLSENFINVYNKTTLLLSINLSSYFKDFCEFKDGKCDMDCLENFAFDADCSLIKFNKGWNLISFPLKLINNSLNYTLNKINYTKVFYYDGKYRELKGNKPIDERYGLWIYVLNYSILEIKGKPFINTTYNITKGWNLINYPYLKEKNISNILNNTNITLVYTYNGSWSSYVQNRTFNSLATMKPGFGYWVKKLI